MINIARLKKAILILSLIFCSGLFAANNSLVPEGYYTNPIETSFGILTSDEYESTLYLVNDAGTETLLSAPGCARYISLSEDRTKIGFKLIDPVTGKQAPAVYDLKTRSVKKLHEDVDKAGQVSFAANGQTSYTIGNELFVNDGSRTDKFDLGIYVNRATISPNGNYVIYKDDNDQLVKFDLLTQTRDIITDNNNGYYNAAWSADGNYVAFQSIDASVFLYDVSKSEMEFISKGENPRWSNDSKEFVFIQKEIDFENIKIISSEIYSYSIVENKLSQITSTLDTHEMDPSFSSDSKDIYYQTYDKREIIKRNLAENNVYEIVVKSDVPLKVKHYQSMRKNFSPNEKTDAPDWVHIHQVWDSRDNGSWTNDPVNGRHQGYLACGATAAMEIVATYGILPPDPISTHGHTSNFGKYLSDTYTYNGYTFSGFNINPNGNPGFRTGAHGFMWNYGSPHSNTVSFLEKHGIEAHLSDNMNWSKVKSELDKGFPYILCSTSLTDGHIVTAIAQYGDGHTLYCNDPYGDKNAGSYGGIRNGKNAIYDWADANTGHIKITPVVWGVTARYSRSLNLMTTYPADNERDISRTVIPMLQFYGAVDPGSVNDKIELQDQYGQSIPVTLDLNKCDDGIVFINPSEQLEAGTDYKIFVRNGIESATGLPFNKNVMVQFSTGVDIVVNETPYDDFESTGSRELVADGVNESTTNITLSDDIKISGSTSAKLEYEFTSAGYCRVLYSPEIELADAENTSVGIWVNGDCSGNNFEFWFSDNNGALEMGLTEVINWSGWKFISFDAVNLNDKNKKYFNCFALRKKTGSLTSGIIYFDDLTVYETFTRVSSHSPAEYEEDVLIESPLVLNFNRSMNAASVEQAFNIAPEIEGSFHWTDEDKTLTFTPSEELAGKTEYIVTIASTATDANGKSFNGDYSYSFVTERTRLSLVEHYPFENETDVSLKPKVVIQFDASINPSTLSGNVLFKDEQNNDVEIVVDFTTYSSGQIVFQPMFDLEENKEYKLILKSAIGSSDNFTFGLDKEIRFTTETNRYISGNIIHDFESVSGWVKPLDAEGSLGLDFINNTFSLSHYMKLNGNNSGMLEYSFNGIEGVSRVQNSEGIPVGTTDQFGMWVYGDFSGNSLEYWFTDSWSNLYTFEVSEINWTGWKLKTVDLTELSQSSDLKFNSIVIKQTDNGSTRSTIYFDDIQSDIVLPVDEEQEILPTQFSLSQNYPNPFNPSTVIEYSIPAISELADSEPVSLKVYDLLGQVVAVLVNKQQKPGTYKVEFDAGNHASGIYIYSLSAGTYSATKKMVVLK